MKKNKLIVRNQVNKRSKNQLLKEDKWEWFLTGFISFFAISVCIYTLSTEEINSDIYIYAQKRLFQIFFILMLLSISTFSFLKSSVKGIIYKIHHSKRINLDDTGVLFLTTTTIVAIISFIFYFDWNNPKKHIFHLSAIAAVTIIRIITVIIIQIKNWFMLWRSRKMQRDNAS